MILLFLVCLVYRRRDRLFAVNRQHILDEIRTVLEVPQIQPPPMNFDENEISPSSPRSLPNTSELRNIEDEEQKSALHPVAPPNTGIVILDRDEHHQQHSHGIYNYENDDNGVIMIDPIDDFQFEHSPPLLVGLGEMIHAPRIEPQTSTLHTSTAPTSGVEIHSSSNIHFSSPDDDSHSSPSLSMINMPHPNPTSSVSPFIEVSPMSVEKEPGESSIATFSNLQLTDPNLHLDPAAHADLEEKGARDCDHRT